MKSFLNIYLILLLGIAFSCKTPSSSTTNNDSSGNNASTGVTEVEIPSDGIDLVAT